MRIPGIVIISSAEVKVCVGFLVLLGSGFTFQACETAPSSSTTQTATTPSDTLNNANVASWPSGIYAFEKGTYHLLQLVSSSTSYRSGANGSLDYRHLKNDIFIDSALYCTVSVVPENTGFSIQTVYAKDGDTKDILFADHEDFIAPDSSAYYKYQHYPDTYWTGLLYDSKHRVIFLTDAGIHYKGVQRWLHLAIETY